MARQRTPSQRDIARIANVSQAAVSFVLNDRAKENGIPESTQRRIRETMADLGYVPNVAARSLRGGRNGLIGVHTFERVFPVSSDDYYNEFLNGIEEQAVEVGVDLVLFTSTQRPDGTRTIYGNGSNRLRLADGAVMLGFNKNDAELARLALEGFPFVFIGRRTVPGASIPCVTADYRAVMGAVVRLLEDHDHRSVVYLGNAVRSGPEDERLAGFREHAAEAGFLANEAHFLERAEVTAEWLNARMREGATAIAVETYELTRALHGVVTGEGVAVPASLSVISLDTDPRGDRENAWSHIDVPRRQMGRRAVELLLGLLDGLVPADHVEVLACEPPGLASVAMNRRPPGRDRASDHALAE